MREEIIKSFIKWAKNCGEEAFYVFDETDEAIENYIKYLKDIDEDEDE